MKTQHSICMHAALLATYATVAAGAALAQSSTSTAVQLENRTQLRAETSDETSSNRLEFISGPEAERHFAKLREQLRDPEQRQQLWATNRAALKDNHPELGASIGIDAETEERLLDLLADHELDRFALIADFAGSMQEQADFETRRLQSLRDLLGEAGAERYRQYADSLHERRMVAKLDDQLPAADKLLADQKTALIGLFDEELRQRIASESNAWAGERRYLHEPAISPGDLQRSIALENIEANERSLRLMQASHRELLEKTRGFLSAAQQAALTQMKADEEQGLREWIEQARARAGLSAAVSEHANPEPRARPTRIPLVRDLSIEFTVKVNRAEPQTTRVVVASGSPVMIGGGDGLLIEATPTLYDDHWLVVDLSYYEEEPGGQKRLIHKGGGFSSLTRLPDGSLGGGGGGGGQTIVGKKGYAIDVLAKML